MNKFEQKTISNQNRKFGNSQFGNELNEIEYNKWLN